MIKSLRINATETTPFVLLDQENNNFLIHGKSYSDESIYFFTPIFEWIDNYLQEPNPESTLVIELTFFNSSTIKHLLSIFFKFECIASDGIDLKIKWICNKHDDYIIQKIHEINQVTTLKSELVLY